MATQEEQEQANRVYSHLDIQSKIIEPDKDIFQHINRNFQLGFIDRRDFLQLSFLLERSLIMMQYPSPLMQRQALENLQLINSKLVLSGSIDGNVRTGINTHTNINKMTQENKGGVLSGVFRKSE